MCDLLLFLGKCLKSGSVLADAVWCDFFFFFFYRKVHQNSRGVITEVLQVPKDTNYHTHLISHYVGLMEQHVWTT